MPVILHSLMLIFTLYFCALLIMQCCTQDLPNIPLVIFTTSFTGPMCHLSSMFLHYRDAIWFGLLTVDCFVVIHNKDYSSLMKVLVFELIQSCMSVFKLPVNPKALGFKAGLTLHTAKNMSQVLSQLNQPLVQI